MYIYIYTYVCLYIYIYSYINICINTTKDIDIDTDIDTDIDIGIDIHTYRYAHTHTHIHTHISYHLVSYCSVFAHHVYNIVLHRSLFVQILAWRSPGRGVTLGVLASGRRETMTASTETSAMTAVWISSHPLT